MTIKIEGPVPLLFLNKKNSNNRIYTQECVEKALKEIDGKEMIGVIGTPSDVPLQLSDAAFTTSEHFIQDEILWAKNVKILDTPRGLALLDMLSDGPDICIRPVGLGLIKDCKIEDYHIHGMSIIPKTPTHFND